MRRRRAGRVQATVVCATIASLLISRPLWFAFDRLYPAAPVAIRLSMLPAALDAFLSAVLVAALLFAVFLPRHRWLVAITIAALAALVLRDQSRLQPWIYDNVAILIALTFAGREDEGDTARFVVAAIYFWSAIQKANFTFLHRTWMEVVGTSVILQRAGIFIPVVECAVAIGLLTRRFRRAAVVAAVLMHTTILILLIRAGENSVVWPWNAAMALTAVFLFWNSAATPREILIGDRRPLHAILVIAFGAMPLLSFFGFWDAYLSSALYSGNTIQAVMFVEPEAVDRLPPIVRANTWPRSMPMFIDFNRWSYDELKVPAYPAARVMKRIGRTLCATPGVYALCILDRPDWRTGARSREIYDCRAVDWKVGDSSRSLTLRR